MPWLFLNKYVALYTHYVIMLKTFSRVVLHSTTKSIIKNKKYIKLYNSSMVQTIRATSQSHTLMWRRGSISKYILPYLNLGMHANVIMLFMLTLFHCINRFEYRFSPVLKNDSRGFTHSLLPIFLQEVNIFTKIQITIWLCTNKTERSDIERISVKLQHLNGIRYSHAQD